MCSTPQLFSVCVCVFSFLLHAGPCSSSTPKAAPSWAGEEARGGGDYAGVDAASLREERHFSSFIPHGSLWSSKRPADSFSHVVSTSLTRVRMFSIAALMMSPSSTGTQTSEKSWISILLSRITSLNWDYVIVCSSNKKVSAFVLTLIQMAG